MDKEIMETVLTEMLEEQKQTNLLNRENTQALLDQCKRLNLIEKKIDSKPPGVIDTKQVEQIIAEGIKKMNIIAENKSREVIHQKRILLFPEHGAREYYKAVFGRLIGWFVLVLIATYCFKLGQEFIKAYHDNNEYHQAYEQLLKEREENAQKIKQKTRVQPK